VIVMFSARRLKPGAYDQFRRSWDPGGARPPGLQAIYHARNIRDEDEVISFGIFDMSPDDYHRERGEHDQEELKRQDAMASFVESISAEGVYEVIEEIRE
jgi:hypothetical protein